MDLFDSGINVTAAKERFMNNEEIFKKYLFQFPFDIDIQQGIECIGKNDLEGAFTHMHKFKSRSGNLAIYKVHEIASEIVDELRVDKCPSEKKTSRLKNEYDKVCNVIRQVEKDGEKLF
jgi:hypothetical protein